MVRNLQVFMTLESWGYFCVYVSCMHVCACWGWYVRTLCVHMWMAEVSVRKPIKKHALNTPRGLHKVVPFTTVREVEREGFNKKKWQILEHD